MGVASQVAELYKKDIATDAEVEMVLCSWDKSPSALGTYLGKAGGTFPTVMVLDAKKQKEQIPELYKQFINRAMGKPVIIDRDGKTIVDIEGRKKADGEEAEAMKALYVKLRDLRAH